MNGEKILKSMGLLSDYDENWDDYRDGSVFDDHSDYDDCRYQDCRYKDYDDSDDSK